MQIKFTNINLELQKTNDKSKFDSLSDRESQLKIKVEDEDNVVISNKAKEILVQHNKPSFNEDKVNEIKERIDNGTYKVDSNKIADKLLGSDF